MNEDIARSAQHEEKRCDPAATSPRRLLYEKQKKMLCVLLEHHAITESQYQFSLRGLAEKMNIREEA